MKIIINESQLRLIIENEEKKERLLTITTDMIEESFDEILDLYNSEKEKKNFVGIRLLDGIDISRGFGNKVGFGVVEFCDELVEVIGDLRVVNNYTIDFPKLRKVTGNMILSMTEVYSLPELRYVGGSLTLNRSKISELPNLESVGDYLGLSYSKIELLPNLKSVGGGLYLDNTSIKDLGNLKYVDGSLDLNKSPIESLPKLEFVDGDLYLEHTPLSKTTTEEELRKQINISGEIYL